MNWLKMRRAVSPIVSILFLTAIMVAAVSVTMGIIYPQMQEVNDNMELVNAANSIQGIDTEIKNFIRSGSLGETTNTLELGETGSIMTNLDALSTIYLIQTIDGVNPTILDTYFLSHNRFIVSQFISQDVISQNTHSYLEGGTGQDVYFLNDTLQSFYPWVIMNQSRSDTKQVNSSLSYRGLISPSKSVDTVNGKVSVTISVQYIVLEFPGKLARSGHNPPVTIEYTNLNVTNSATAIVPDILDSDVLVYLKFSTLMDGLNRVEIPFKHEVPTDGTLEITFQFIVHHFSLRF